MGAFRPLMALAQVRRGAMRAATLGGREILVCHSSEGLYALDNICTHAHARLCEGRLRGTRLICPLHGAVFDVRDGQVLKSPAVVALPTLPLRVVAGIIEVEL